MNKTRLIIIGIALFVYTLAIIGLTTMIVYPDPNKEDGLPTEQQDCNCVDDSGVE
ncbi:hypothetical protein [Virgibacillus oceani]|uniref:Uncharacterized protein n=1 Tax=Virgibacillus oceani TaxID=1479511 RepID=A0A917HBT2_9BACI|nr:hypothetical protein [Virgibacillus oceani]GGG73496.1 hypothetical protein GCM10011398_17440 [Virgibacillus oceani]